MDISKSINIGCALFNKKKGDMAREVGKSTQAVSGWCGGKSNPSLETVSKIAEFFGVSVSTFIEWGE
jgi:transcriptional regulator with XRE-family HTH domain